MLYIVSKGKELLGSPIIADSIEEVNEKILERQVKQVDVAKKALESNPQVNEILEKINALDSIIEQSKDTKATKEAKETAEEAKNIKKGFKEEIQAVEDKINKIIDAWTFELSELDYYIISPLDKIEN